MNNIEQEKENLKNELDAFISIKDATEILKCSRGTIYNLIKQDKIKAVKVGVKKSLISLESIKNYIKEIKGE